LLTSGIFVAIVVFGLLTVLFCLYFSAYKKRNQFPAVVHAARSLSPLLTVEPQFIEVIHEGALASVHRARRGREEIVVKLFPDTPESKKCWNQEMNIYMTENLKHDNLLRFIDFAENIKEENTYWLLFDYHPLGSLYDYLHESSITIKELAVFAKSIADGLSHLHSCDGKSSIAHRDLKSKNILVKQDLTCCICDLGVAIRFDPGHNFFKRAVIQVGWMDGWMDRFIYLDIIILVI
jgi:serine/threonine protein kinase